MDIAHNPFHIAQAHVDRACKLLNLEEPLRQLLREPQREFWATLPLRMDDGSTRIFQAYRVQYNNARGPTKGGVRWHANETIDTVRALACWMTWKAAIVDLPLGGGKGGVTCNPKELSLTERERLARAYVRAFARELSVHRDVPAPDVNTTPQIMAWMMDEYETILGEHHPGVITGKPIALGGSRGREDATSYGGLCIIREADRVLGFDFSTARYAVQGFGNVGGGIARLLHEAGARVVAVSAEDGALYDERGIDVPAALLHYQQQGGRLEGFSGGSWIDNEQLLACDCDVLIPAAIEHVLTHENAPRVRARLICELANGPTTPGADHAFQQRGIVVIPDILANVGGVTVSYFEQVQNSYNYYWSIDDVREQLNRRMSEAFQSLWKLADERRITLREAAYLLAVDRVALACRTRGWV